jgi:hypothetical protein
LNLYGFRGFESHPHRQKITTQFIWSKRNFNLNSLLCKWEGFGFFAHFRGLGSPGACSASWSRGRAERQDRPAVLNLRPPLCELLLMLPKGFGQQREVSESKNSSWLCVLSTTYRHAGRKLYCAESDFRITSTVDTLGLPPSAVNRRQHIDSLPSLGLDNNRRPFEPKPLTQPVD